MIAKITIKYTVPDGIMPELDDALEEMFKEKFGMVRKDSGTDLVTGERDIAFEMK
jgi:hypothetical protein